MAATIIGAAAAALWVYLIAFRGGFWRIRQPAVAVSAAPPRSVVAVIPARNEEAVIERAVSSLLAQRYRGPFHIVVVDDHSSDGTARLARAAAADAPDRLTLAAAQPVPAGWTGKLWERLLIPAFVFFFFKLYPPRLVADPGRRTAAAAGGCMLIRRDTLERIGGVDSIRREIIDDCALARRVKAVGAVWLGAAGTTSSIREYRSWRPI